MKKILALTIALGSLTAFAQNSYYAGNRQNQEASTGTEPVAAPGVRHMLEFSAQTMESLVLSFDRTKSNGRDADSGANLNFDVNYAYGVHRLLQAGMRVHYLNGLSGANQAEEMNFEVGGIFNMNPDFTRSMYGSLYVGAGWAQDFGQGTRDDLRLATVAVGKRFPLEMFGVKHVTYSPEIALQMINSTNDEDLDYSQSLQFRILQFSVFF